MKLKRIMSKTKLGIWFMILIALLAAAAICLSFFAPKEGVASGPLPLKEFETKALEEVRKLIPEAESMEGYPTSSEKEADGIVYSLKDEKGNGIGLMSADSLTGEVVCYYDCRQQGPSAEVLISLDQARDIAIRFLLDEKGVDAKAGPVVITSEKLQSKGMEGPPQNPIQTYQYMFEFGEIINGARASEGTTASVVISPKDGRIISFSIQRHDSISSGKEVGATKISIDEATAIATKAAQEKLQLFTAPYITSDREPYFADLGDGHLTTYLSLQFVFGERDLTSVMGGEHTINVVVSLETGEILHIEIISDETVDTSEMAR